MRTRLEVPLSEVRGARLVAAREARRDLWLRTGGVALPGVATVGHYPGRQSKRQWWQVYRAPEVVAIDLSPESRVDRTVLQVDDPPPLVAAMDEALSSSRKEDGR